MKKHEIKIGELQDWQMSEKVLYASCSKDKKRLYVTLRGSYEIYHKGELVLETFTPFDAVKKYNEL